MLIDNLTNIIILKMRIYVILQWKVKKNGGVLSRWVLVPSLKSHSIKSYHKIFGSWTVYRQPVYRHPVYRQPVYRHPVYRHDRLIDSQFIDTTIWSTRPFDRHDRFIDKSIFIKDFRHNFTLARIKIIFWNFVYRCIWSPQFEYERIFYRSQVIFEIIDFTFLIDLILIMIFLYKFIKFTRDFDLIWPNLT